MIWRCLVEMTSCKMPRLGTGTVWTDRREPVELMRRLDGVKKAGLFVVQVAKGGEIVV